MHPWSSRAWRRVPAAGLSLATLAALAGPSVAAPPRAELMRIGDTLTWEPEFRGLREAPPVVHLVNRGGPLVVEVRRPEGATAWTAEQVLDGTRLPLPRGVAAGPSGLGRAIEVTVLDRARRVVSRRAIALCVNEGRVRLGTRGPALSAFPAACAAHPFARGVRLGLDTDYGVPIDIGRAIPARLRPGRHTVRVAVRPEVARWLGMAANARAVTVRLNAAARSAPTPVVPEHDHGAVGIPGVFAPSGAGREAPGRYRPRPRTPPPPTDVVPPPDALPNLAALPAFDVSVMREGTRDRLWFAATVWNAGPGPLVVEGYRASTAPLMSAHQFFRRAGEDVAAVPVGEFDYDARRGHEHWHFRDFAQYSLVRVDGRPARRSPKEAWCLAPTDQIDQFVPNVELRLGDPNLSTACGDARAVQVRQVLEVGAGDTYGAGTPGQAIDITTLPNGAYFLKVRANPAGVLRETTFDDNVALRRIILRGRPGKRTVVVPPYRGIDTDGGSRRR